MLHVFDSFFYCGRLLQLDTFKMWLYRRTERIPWTEINQYAEKDGKGKKKLNICDMFAEDPPPALLPSLLTHVYKVFSNILLQRLSPYTEETINAAFEAEDQQLTISSLSVRV